MNAMLFFALLIALVVDCDAVNRTVLLLGDSLINRPYNEHNLSGIIASLVDLPPGDSIEYINAGNNGNEIADILARTPQALATYTPWATILFWDSDCSNIDESTMTPAQVAQLRQNYTDNVMRVISLVVASKSKLAVAGPELLGEGPLFLPPRFANKTGMLDAYRVLTRNATEQFAHVPYIDMRFAFMAVLPLGWNAAGPYCCYVTIDGEHPNPTGTAIEAQLFAEQINAWLAE